MKTTFKKYITEDVKSKAESAEDLLSSVVDGKFTKDGSHLLNIKDFDCSNMKLESLVGSPKKVNMDFNCSGNRLKSLVGGPIEVGGDLWCSSSHIETFEGFPKIIGADVWCSDNHLTSLESIHMHIHEIGVFGQIFLTGNPIKSHVLGLLKIKNLKSLSFRDNEEMTRIMNKYLNNNRKSVRDIVDCQEELMDNDLEDFALL